MLRSRVFGVRSSGRWLELESEAWVTQPEPAVLLYAAPVSATYPLGTGAEAGWKLTLTPANGAAEAVVGARPTAIAAMTTPATHHGDGLRSAVSPPGPSFFCRSLQRREIRGRKRDGFFRS